MEFYKSCLGKKDNKYSIRKFSVGIASILVGSAFIYGNSNEAKASEESVNNQNTQQNEIQNGNQESRNSEGTQNQALQQNVSSNTHMSTNDVQDQTTQPTNQPNESLTTRSAQPQRVQAPVQNNSDNIQSEAQKEKAPLKSTNVESKVVDKNTKKLDVVKYVEDNSNQLTDVERKFYLRAVARETSISNNSWKNVYDKEYSKVSELNGQNVAENKVENVNAITKAVSDLIKNRDSDSYYTNLRSDNTGNQANKFTLNNNIQRTQEGNQIINLGLSKDIIPITYPHNGKWLPWDHRFDIWGLRTNNSLNSKIEEVRIKYKWKGQSVDEVLTRDKDGFYWLKENEKYKAKAHIGGGVNFHLKLKKDAILDKARDAAWGYIFSDAEHFFPQSAVTFGFQKFNFSQSGFDKNFNNNNLNGVKQKLTTKLNNIQSGLFTQPGGNKDYYLQLVTKATSNLQDYNDYKRAKLTLENINKRIDVALKEVKPVKISGLTVDSNSKMKDILDYINNQKAHLSQPELELFLRNASRITNTPNLWKSYNENGNSTQTTSISGKSEDINYINKLLKDMQSFIESRNSDNLYKEFAKDTAVKTLANHFGLTSITQENGKQVANIEIKRDGLELDKFEGGKYNDGLTRFEQRALRTNESINNKIEKVTATYRWQGKNYEDVLTRDDKGFYWFREDVKFPNGKKSVGGTVNLKVTFKKDTLLNKDTDKMWGYNISDANEALTVFGSNIGFSRINLDNSETNFNVKTLSNLKESVLNNVQSLAPVFLNDDTTVNEFNQRINNINTSASTQNEFENAKDQLVMINHQLAKTALKNNLIVVPEEKQHLGQYAQEVEDSHFSSFQSLNTDPNNSLNSDSSIVIKPKGYFFYNFKAENELAPGKKINIKLVASKVDPKTKFQYSVQNGQNVYLAGISEIPKVSEGNYTLDDYVIPEGAKKFTLRIDNREGTTNTNVKGFKLVPAEGNDSNSKVPNLVVIPEDGQNIKTYAANHKDSYFSSFQSLNTNPVNTFNSDGSLTLKPNGYFFYNFKAENELAPNKKFNIKVMSNSVDPKTKFEYGFQIAGVKFGNTIKAIVKSEEGIYSVEDVVVPENATSVALRLDNRLGKQNAEIQGVFVLPSNA
ncbi:YSIRK-type signal peptide-containing protein [Staphylococcus durrellii]|uniref:YSIRK-type signal peptide-containing protein n=1 Tax=Staphylococcus durrellii TaxID=2781773 RepID=UPI0018A0665D|nr:YSIRK-type signal peptide-containing protein [Staphylococcus durrellii]MBF7017224.1 YSIRK-type signal peptide-containing protein [Staphylococcus durrellii]